jgi:hypothetical protein
MGEWEIIHYYYFKRHNVTRTKSIKSNPYSFSMPTLGAVELPLKRREQRFSCTPPPNLCLSISCKQFHLYRSLSHVRVINHRASSSERCYPTPRRLAAHSGNQKEDDDSPNVPGGPLTPKHIVLSASLFHSHISSPVVPTPRTCIFVVLQYAHRGDWHSGQVSVWMLIPDRPHWH